jgi:malonate transporter MadL subunit
LLHERTKFGIEFWAMLYIPIVVAMAAIQNVAAAVSGGPIVVLAGVGGVAVCLVATAVLIRTSCPRTDAGISPVPPERGIASEAAE